MSQPAKAQEPSMEEILASIRRIIADDDTGRDTLNSKPAGQPRAAPPPAPPPPRSAASKQDEIDAMIADLDTSGRVARVEAVPDILDLTEQMAAPVPAATGFRTIHGEPDVVFSDEPGEPPPPPPRPQSRMIEEPRPRPMPSAHNSQLLSQAATAAVDQAFSTLANTVLGSNARTLEDLVKDMLRPMLKTWLDDNLPVLVERLVRSEIERVSRGRP
jgi:cell pole-organizing protein PopZ